MGSGFGIDLLGCLIALSESLDGVEVGLLLFLSVLDSVGLDSSDDSLPSESFGGDESLDLGSFDVGLAALGGDLPLRGELGDHEAEGLPFLGVLLLLVVDFEEAELLEDVVGSLGAESLGHGVFREAGNRVGADLGHLEVQNSDVGGDDASSD